MSSTSTISGSGVPRPSDMLAWAEAINQAIQRFSDKDWNYSRITLVSCDLKKQVSPYVLGIDWLDTHGKKGQADYKAVLQEVTWGQRHSHELGILEIVSLRLNDALSQVTSTEYWHGVRPVIRLQKRSDFLEKGQTHAFWYQIQEAQGIEFENR